MLVKFWLVSIGSVVLFFYWKVMQLVNATKILNYVLREVGWCHLNSLYFPCDFQFSSVYILYLFLDLLIVSSFFPDLKHPQKWSVI